MTKILITTDENKGERLDIFLLSKFKDFSRSYIKSMIEKGLILVDDKAQKAGFALKPNMKISVKIVEPEKVSTVAEDIDFEIVYQDQDLVVVNKPQGLVVHPCTSTKSGTLVNGLLFKIDDLSGINGEYRPGIVHRLDKDTSGLLVVAKNDVAHRNLAEQIKNKTAKRSYLALLEGNLKQNSGRIETYIGRDLKDRKKMAVCQAGRLAISDFVVIERFENSTLVEFRLQTGRTHQIRVHAKFLHHPVVGDKLYGKEIKSLKGQLLHAYRLEIVHPSTSETMIFKADLPDYFQNYLNKQTKLI